MHTILLVEDNELNRTLLSERLGARGFKVLTALDGKAGLAQARDERPDLILMDLSLPVLDGWEATRCLKAGPETKSIPVIALTAHGLAEDRRLAAAAGCDAYETKPVHFERLMETVRRLLPEAAG